MKWIQIMEKIRCVVPTILNFTSLSLQEDADSDTAPSTRKRGRKRRQVMPIDHLFERILIPFRLASPNHDFQRSGRERRAMKKRRKKRKEDRGRVKCRKRVSVRIKRPR